MLILTTDEAWEEWGKKDPYFGVITSPKFRRAEINNDAIREFFLSGSAHAEYVVKTIKKYLDPNFSPVSIVDFGCGVGRVTIPLSKIADRIIGIDVSVSMLEEAKRNCEKFGVTNVQLQVSDDQLTGLTGEYDLIHSFIVFQHIQPQRGREIFRALVSRLRMGGVAALHFSYAKNYLDRGYGFDSFTRPIVKKKSKIWNVARKSLHAGSDPEMQMNPYLLNELFLILQSTGIERCHIEFTNHAGELGVFLYFIKTRPENVVNHARA